MVTAGTGHGVQGEETRIGGTGRDVKSKESRILECQAVVAALGFTADIAPLEAWGLAVSERHILVDTTMATNLPRVFAAGDITEYLGKVRLISVGFGEAATAVNNAATVVDPQPTVFPSHSTRQVEGPTA
mgnify:CR=1 FL=1